MSAPSHIRQDLLLNVGTDVANDPYCVLRASRTGNVLPTDAAEYELIVERFCLSSMDIPLSVIPVQLGQSDYNKTIYSVTLQSDVSGYYGVVAGQTDTFALWVGGGVTVERTLPVGTYTGAQLAALMQTALQSLNTYLSSPTCTYNSGTNRFVITATAIGSAISIATTSGVAVTGSASGLLGMMGFIGAATQVFLNINTTATTLTAQYAPDSSNVTAKVSKTVQWVPQVTDAPMPMQPLTAQDVSSAYYYLYDYEYFATLVNAALKACLADLVSLYGVSSSLEAPFFEFDVSNYTFCLYGKQTQFDDATGTMKLFANESFYQLFPNFQVALKNSDPVCTYQYKFIAAPSGINLDSNGRIIMNQQFPNLNNWSALDSLVLTTSTIPIVSEGVCPAGVFGPSNKGSISGTSNATMSIITDMQVAGNYGYEFRQGCVWFVPSSEYRVVSLHSGSFKSLDVAVYWRDKYGNLTPLTLPVGASCSIKLLFRRKDWRS